MVEMACPGGEGGRIILGRRRAIGGPVFSANWDISWWIIMMV